MSKQAPELFVTTYEKRIATKFQRMGKRLLRLCRSKDATGKKTITMFVGGTGTASERPSRNSEIPYMNSGREKVTMDLVAKFAGDPVDWEDLESMELDDIQTIADTAALAIQRAIDDTIITAITTGATLSEGAGTEAFSVRMLMNGVQKAQEADWPDEEGSWHCLLGPNAWGHLMTYKQFASADYVGGDNLPWANKANYRNWNGVNFHLQRGLTSPAANRENGLLFYGPNVAAAGAPAPTDISWLHKEQMWSIMDKVRTAAKVVQGAGALKFDYLTNVAFQDVYHTPA